MNNKENFIEELRRIFVSLERYELEVPQLKNIVYGAIAMIVIAVFSAWITVVIKTK